MTTTPPAAPPADPHRRRSPLRTLLRSPLRVALAVVVVLGVAVAGYATGSARQRAQDLAERQADVAERGRGVMPFDLEQTTHVFAERPDGGVQTVVADDPSDAEQVRLIREHLRAEADAFTRGDFADPASIHGEDMPGLAELQQGAARIAIHYQDVADGARITYTTEDPGLVDALHAWFRAQTSDHGDHAEHQGS